MSGKTIRLNDAELEALSSGAAELDGLALDIRMSSSLGGRGIEWDAESDKAAHDRLKALSAKLYALRERAKA